MCFQLCKFAHYIYLRRDATALKLLIKSLYITTAIIMPKPPWYCFAQVILKYAIWLVMLYNLLTANPNLITKHNLTRDVKFRKKFSRVENFNSQELNRVSMGITADSKKKVRSALRGAG